MVLKFKEKAEMEYICDLFTEWADKWQLEEFEDEYFIPDVIDKPAYFISMPWQLPKLNSQRNIKYQLSIFFPDNYGNCGVPGTGAFNQNCYYLSSKFIHDMDLFINKLKKIGYKKSDHDFRGGYLEFKINIKL